MKIIALMPVKNEAWILPTILTPLFCVVDELVVLDDNSNDNSKEIIKSFGGKVISIDFGKEKVVDMSKRRQKLLEEGRKRGGTHFVWLDADEVFSANFIPKARKIISKLKPGQKLMLEWVHFWKSDKKYRTDGVYKNLYKDFVVCDDKNVSFDDKFLSEGRTPGKNNSKSLIKINRRDGVVIHFQFLDWERNQIKQAWYRCSELIEGSRSSRRINNTYSTTLDGQNTKLESVPDVWIDGLVIPENNISIQNDWHYKEILYFFDKYGIEYFEDLEIWHISKLHEEFVRRKKRNPKIKKFHPLLIFVNNIKNKIKNLT